MESILDQHYKGFSNDYLLDSFIRASYVHAAFEAGLIQELRKILRDQQELFLSDLPIHIVLAISDDEDPEDLSVSRGIVERMMTHGLSTRFAVKNILTCIEGNCEVPKGREFPFRGRQILRGREFRSRVRERRTSFLKEWRKREIGFSMQRMALIQKFLAQVNRPFMPSSVLHMIDSFLLGEFLAVLDDEVGVAFEL